MKNLGQNESSLKLEIYTSEGQKIVCDPFAKYSELKEL